MRWLSFLRDGSETFGYVVGDAAAGRASLMPASAPTLHRFVRRLPRTL